MVSEMPAVMDNFLVVVILTSITALYLFVYGFLLNYNDSGYGKAILVFIYQYACLFMKQCVCLHISVYVNLFYLCSFCTCL